MNKWLALCVIILVALVGAALIPVGSRGPEAMAVSPRETIDMSEHSTQNLPSAHHLLFIHHSCGGQLFADPGPEVGESCIYKTHDNGGGLRARLEAAGYAVHEASYGSRVGDKTDIFDWPPKFQAQMDEILSVAHQDTRLPEGQRNQIVAFKSCYPNNLFVGEGAPPGEPRGPELTVANAQAAYSALLPLFERHPAVLFVAVTAPPIAEPDMSTPLWKLAARKVLGKAPPVPSGPLARRFNNWLKDASAGWLAGYQGKNVVVFDYYDILTGEGRSNYSVYPTGGGTDSHPSADGNRRAAEAFVPFLNQAARRAGLEQGTPPRGVQE